MVAVVLILCCVWDCYVTVLLYVVWR